MNTFKPEFNLEPYIARLRDTHRRESVGSWARIPKDVAARMAGAVIEEYETRRREQELLDIIDS